MGSNARHPIPANKHNQGETPSPNGMKPQTVAIAAAMTAYGSCVCTWSNGSKSQAMAETMVVSLKGEQWSPNTAPLKTAATMQATKDSFPGDNVNATGNAKGIRTPIVPQDVPVVKEIRTPSRNTATGR